MSNNSSQWISLSDMMTWLMLVFLLISILTMSEIKKKEEVKNKVLVEYSNVKEEIYNDLKKAFADKEEKWEMKIGDDLSIRFTNPDILFEPDKNNIKEWFASILNEFIPKYLSIINNKKYEDKIKEVRIEGHAWKCLDFEYMECLWLSQSRANSVLQYVISNNYYVNLNKADKDKFKFLLTSNWMSDWRNLDSTWEYVYNSKKELDSKVSRRVEFRIVSNSEDLVEELLKQIDAIKNKD